MTDRKDCGAWTRRLILSKGAHHARSSSGLRVSPNKATAHVDASGSLAQYGPSFSVPQQTLVASSFSDNASFGSAGIFLPPGAEPSFDPFDFSALLFDNAGNVTYPAPSDDFLPSSYIQPSLDVVERSPPGLVHSPESLPGTPLHTPQAEPFALPDVRVTEHVAQPVAHQPAPLPALPSLPQKPLHMQRSGIMDIVLNSQQYKVPATVTGSPQVRIAKSSARPRAPAPKRAPAQPSSSAAVASSRTPIQLPTLVAPYAYPALPPAITSNVAEPDATIGAKRKREEEVQPSAKRAKAASAPAPEPARVTAEKKSDLPTSHMSSADLDFFDCLGLPSMDAGPSSDYPFDMFATSIVFTNPFVFS